MVRKKEEGEGDGALHVLCAQNSLFRIATPPVLIVLVIFSGGGLLPQTFVLCRTCVLASLVCSSWSLAVVFIRLTKTKR